MPTFDLPPIYVEIKATSDTALPGSLATDEDAKFYNNRLDPWDVVEIGGKALPGKCELEGEGVEHQIDIKKVPGKNGATFSDLGRDIGKFTVKITIWTAEHWRVWMKMRSALQPLAKGTTRLQPVDVRHPALNSLGINSLYITKVGVPRKGALPGTIEVELRCIEYRRSDGKVLTGVVTPKSSKYNLSDLDPSAANYQAPDGTQTRLETLKPSAGGQVSANYEMPDGTKVAVGG